ncbi:ABC transporter [Microbacterium schleiferi]|uniref:ABC transporter n=1 Tax=Microbacterium schleiferi TaxID=69362 RepID=A0A7S8MYH9_9MICO|nr:ABC transporter [Microbacterium schleiferi]QPE04900.1 ABC transporter [Microbacterium schleiferi]
MSDDKPTPGEPVEEPVGEPVAEEPPVDDVVGSARESLADAEAAGSPETPASDQEPAAEPVVVEPVVVESAPSVDEPAVVETVAAEPVVVESAAAETAAPTEAYEAAVVATAVTASEPGVGAYGAQPIFVQAPEAPRPRGNRAAAGAIGLLAALSFGVLYLAVWVGLGLVDGSVTVSSIGTALLAALATWSLWVPVVVFFIAFWLLGAIINRGRWAAWVIFGLLVGAAAYGGHLLGQLFQAPFWTLTAQEGAELVEGQLLAPLAIAAFIIGRELTIWFGSWVAARGKRMTELNVEARREYERTLEAGPQLHQY